MFELLCDRTAFINAQRILRDRLNFNRLQDVDISNITEFSIFSRRHRNKEFLFDPWKIPEFPEEDKFVLVVKEKNTGYNNSHSKIIFPPRINCININYKDLEDIIISQYVSKKLLCEYFI